MNNKDKIEKILKIFNRNIPLNEEYTINEIKEIFKLLKTYESCTNREKDIYNRFFTEFANDNDIKLLCTIDNVTTTKLKKLYLSYSDEKKIEFSEFWFKRFRLKKIRIDDTINNVKIKITPRSDKKYSELDKFQIYELTPCIAYEMAIRNQNIKYLLMSI